MYLNDAITDTLHWIQLKTGYLRRKFYSKYGYEYHRECVKNYRVLKPEIYFGVKYYPVEFSYYFKSFAKDGTDITWEGFEAGIFLDGSDTHRIIEYFKTREEAEAYCEASRS